MAKKFILAVDLGGTNLKIGLLDLKYKILSKRILTTRSLHKQDSLIQAIVSAVNNILSDFKLERQDVVGLGLGLPGPIDIEKGLVHFFPNIPGWKEVALKKILEKRLALRVFLDNDANLMCLAEYKLGAAKGTQNAVCLTLGTGVGAGIIINASLYRARTFAAGEIGHIPLNEQGPRCNCGGLACLETYVGNNRLKPQAIKAFKKKISLEEVSALAKKGNKKAQAFWSMVGAHLGIGLVGVVNLLSPDIIVIGGGVANAGEVLFASARKIVRERAMKVQAEHVKIVKAILGEDAGLIGAAILAKEGY